ncbi:MAG: nuclear transport factor 2 family protein [Pseudomonadota bacterium]
MTHSTNMLGGCGSATPTRRSNYHLGNVRHITLGAAALAFGLFSSLALAQNPATPSGQPTKSSDQELTFLQSVPTNFETHIYVADEEGARRAQMIIDIYKLLETGPTIEALREDVADGYIQHSTMLPDGPQPLAMLFSSSAKQYPVAIDVHKVAVVGDFAMAHVNFRNTDTADPDDLGIAAVDMYLFGEDGKIVEHWDTLQNVPTHSANPNTMFLKLYKGDEQ